MAAVPSIGRADRPAAAPREAELTRALYERHAAQIFRYCLHQLGSREEAEDAVQSAYLNAFRGIKRGIVPEHEAAWLFKIAENVCLSRRRSSWRRGSVESPTGFDFVEEHASAPTRLADELLGLQDVLAHMPESQRRAILLREWRGLSYREIANELKLSQTAVETLIFRARRSLAKGLEEPPEPANERRMVRGADLGNILTALKSLLIGGGAATAKVVAVVAVVGAGTVVASSPVRKQHSSVPVKKPVAHARTATVHASHVAVATPPAPPRKEQRQTALAPHRSAPSTSFVSAVSKPTVATDAPATPVVTPAAAPQPAVASPPPAMDHPTSAPEAAPPPSSTPSHATTTELPPPDQPGYGHWSGGGQVQASGNGQGDDVGQGIAPTQGASTPSPAAPPAPPAPAPSAAPLPTSNGDGQVGYGQPSSGSSASNWSGSSNGHGGGGHQRGGARLHGHGH